MSATEIKPRLIWVAISIGAFCREEISLADTAGEVQLPLQGPTGALSNIRTMPGRRFLWLLLKTRAAQGVFGAVRDYGPLLHTKLQAAGSAMHACAQSFLYVAKDFEPGTITVLCRLAKTMTLNR